MPDFPADSFAAPYIGRFAPSPTGPLHFGSLLAALASYLDARQQHGLWLLRIEDIDPPREDPTAASRILQILDAYGLHWDGEVRYQSQRHDNYLATLDQLIQQGDAFACACSRKQLQNTLHLDGHCLAPVPENPDLPDSCAWRFKVRSTQQEPLCFDDRLQGQFCLSPAQDIGDFVIRRRDMLWSYQLAVVTDDHDQGINQIVRGIDLIDSTQRQLLIYQALGWPAPIYAHIPVAVEQNGQKLSKQNLARALEPDDSGSTLWTALQWLKQSPPIELQQDGNQRLLDWAIQHWNPNVLTGQQQLAAPAQFQRLPGN
ncbi:tRNA glutamyl-Q(34) synthetase GluQRS [Oceanobacter mangrovi]|uniref:tRNA glutamyl-Q(34) synthetase GluQRS n=1 Tax=Oceanobacter mangrovi TaxID=2862510 RepID=UPI001C8D563E|nr:tRNA glutamyl-Q(34) synthetase GluQRS [Oceanobacter mangrovi]